jgi:sodium transport system permease protein
VTRKALVIFAKELRETLRDRRTLFVMVLLPMILYPLLALISIQWVAVVQARREAKASPIAVVPPDREMEDVVRAEPKLQQVTRDAKATLRVSGSSGAAPRRTVTIVWDPADDDAALARDRVHAALLRHADEERDRRLQRYGVPPGGAEALLIREEGGRPGAAGGQLAGLLLPMLLVMMVVAGAFYPAIDLTAGEKERGTLETLLAAPVSRHDVLGGKYLAVVTVSLLTGTINLASAALTFAAVFRPAAGSALPEVPWASVAVASIVTVPAALFFSAVMLAVAALARGFKDAQNLLTPVYLAILVPAMMSQLPGTELGTFTALIPGVNVTLLVKALVRGDAQAAHVALAVLSMTAYALMALHFAARVFEGERLLFAEERARARRARGSAAEAVGLVGIVFLLVFYVGAWLQHGTFWLGILATEWLLVLVPCLVFARLSGLRARTAFSLHRPRGVVWLGAALVGAGAWAVASAVGWAQQAVLPMPREAYEALRGVLFPTPARPLFLDLLALALSPAICEEILFRGVLLGSLRPRIGTAWSVVLTAFLFGAFHMSLHKFLPTAVLGVMLAVIAARTGSIVPGMLVHFIHNAIVVVSGRVLGPEAILDDKVPRLAVGLGSLVVVAGLYVLRRAPAQHRTTDP